MTVFRSEGWTIEHSDGVLFSSLFYNFTCAFDTTPTLIMSLLRLLSSPSLQSYSEIPDNLTFHFMTTTATAVGGRNITLKTGEHNP